MTKISWHIEKKKVSELKENPKNPRILTEKGLADLEKSIAKFGVAEPLVLNLGGMICGGHGRKKILERLQIKEVDCYIPSRKLTQKEFDELNIRLNKNIAGEFDYDILANEFELPDLLDWGFDYQELIGSDTEKLKEQSQELKPYNKVHILISLHPDKFLEIKNYLNEIKKIDGIEIEQSAN
jgi:ParB-like chromosome segregation protein Spo0J